MKKLEELSNKTNRSIRQTEMLYELVGRDFERLVLLEEIIKSKNLFYCPSTKWEIDKLMNE